MTAVAVTLSNLWLTDLASNTSVTGLFPARGMAANLGGAARFYAGGRRRVITTKNDTRDYALVLQWVSDAELALLLSWRGRMLLMRDSGGWRVFGSYLDLAVTDNFISGDTRHQVTLTFAGLTYVEGV